MCLRGCSIASNRSGRSYCGSSVASAVTLAVAAVNATVNAIFEFVVGNVPRKPH